MSLAEHLRDCDYVLRQASARLRLAALLELLEHPLESLGLMRVVRVPVG